MPLEPLVLVACHSLEDFPTYLQGADADELLAAWTALWHPGLISLAEVIPRWQPSDDPVPANRAIVVPSFVQKRLAADYSERAAKQGSIIVAGSRRREQLAADLLTACGSETKAREAAVDADLTADFYALGYCYLIAQLLAIRMRCSNLLDSARFSQAVVAAAKAALAGGAEEARSQLSTAFDLLQEARQSFLSGG